MEDYNNIFETIETESLSSVGWGSFDGRYNNIINLKIDAYRIKHLCRVTNHLSFIVTQNSYTTINGKCTHDIKISKTQGTPQRQSNYNGIVLIATTSGKPKHFEFTVFTEDLKLFSRLTSRSSVLVKLIAEYSDRVVKIFWQASDRALEKEFWEL